MAKVQHKHDVEIHYIQTAIGEARALLGMLQMPVANRHSIDDLLEQADNVRLALLGQL